MAISPHITSSPRKIRVKDVQNEKPNSESVNAKIGGSINFLIERNFYQLDSEFPGYFGDTKLFRGAPYRVEKQSDLIYYQLSVDDSGSGSNNNAFNVAIYDDAGAFVNNLFGSGANQLFISGDNGSRVVIGRNLEDATTFQTNTAGHTIQFGNANLTTLNAGYILVPFVEEHSSSARSIRFTARLREQ